MGNIPLIKILSRKLPSNITRLMYQDYEKKTNAVNLTYNLFYHLKIKKINKVEF